MIFFCNLCFFCIQMLPNSIRRIPTTKYKWSVYPPPLTLVWIIQELISVVICRLSLVFSFVFCHTCVILSLVIVVFHLTFVVCHWSQWKSSVMCSFLKEKVKVKVLVRSQELRILANCNQIDLNCSLREAILRKKKVTS